MLRLLICSLVSSACGGMYCTAEELEQALAAAEPGEIVRVGACRFTGSFSVPEGVTLSGEGPSSSQIDAAPGQPALVLQPGQPTRVSDLTIGSSSPIAILARGAGETSIARVVVESTLGVGIGAEDLTHVELTSVSIEGPIDASNAASVFPPITATTYATWGLVLIDIAQADLQDVDIRGFASGGAAFQDSAVDWDGGSAQSNRAHGVLQNGGSSVLTSVTLSETLQTNDIRPAFAGAFVGSATVTTSGLRVEANQDRGLFHRGGTARHAAIEIRNNPFVGIWAEAMGSIELDGIVEENGLAGVLAIDVASVSIHDARIDATTLVPRIVGTVGSVDVGDGIQLVRSHVGASIQDVSLSGNLRNGVTLELDGGAVVAGIFSSVTVTALSAGAHAAVAQNGTIDPAWDVGLTRVDVASSFDSGALLPAVDGVGPCEVPPPDATTGGLSGLTGL